MALFNRIMDNAAKARIAAYEAELQANAVDVDWLAEEEKKDSEYPITVRGNGKCHPAIMHSRYGLIITCSCPGSQNGSLAHSVRKVCGGHEKVNCNK